MGRKSPITNHQEEVVEEEAGQLMAPVGNAKRTGPAESILQQVCYVVWFFHVFPIFSFETNGATEMLIFKC
jgi:hypothetical protein